MATTDTYLTPLTTCTPPANKFQPRGLTILHEDKDLIVIDKPSGLLTIGSEHNKKGTAHYLLNDYVRKGNPKSRNRVFVVHRLDRATSGLLVFAKSEPVKKFLQQNWKQTTKHYLAIVHGHLTDKEGTFTSHLSENSANNVYSTSAGNQGKLATTAYRVIKETSSFSLIAIHLLTGRKHQIRVHFAENGHPIVGDQKYGAENQGSKRLMLHSKSLEFLHPFSKKKLRFIATTPENFIRLIGKI